MSILKLAGIALSILMSVSTYAMSADLAPTVRQRFVPADRPDLWPDADTIDWVPVRQNDLDQLLQRVRTLGSAQRTISFSKATYTATFEPESLSFREGTATLNVATGRISGEVIPCEPLNLSIGTPSWENSDSPVVLGAVPTGAHFLVIAEDSRTLRFDWQLTGTQRLSGVEFLVRVPTAVASTLTLQLPKGWALKASSGTVSRDRKDGGPTVWRLDLGRRTETRLRLIEPGQSTATQQNELTTASLNSRFELTPLVVDSATEVSFESLAANASSLDLQLAEAWQIRSVERASGGSVAWQDLGPTDGLRRLRVEIPEGVAAAERAFVVNASLPLQLGTRLQLAAPRLTNAVLFDGRFQVSLGPPFTLQEYAAVGLSQTDVSAESGSGGRTLLTFHQFAADAHVSLSLRDDASSRARLVSVREFSVGRFDLNPPEFHADLQVTARSREVFSLESCVPNGWELTRVTHRVASGLQVELPWRVIQSQPGGPDRVLINLPDGVETGRPTLLQISAQHVAWTRETIPTLPALFPDIKALTSVTTGLVSASEHAGTTIRIDGFEPVEKAITLPRFAWSPTAEDLGNLPISLHTLDYWENAERLASQSVRRQGVVDSSTGATGDAVSSPVAPGSGQQSEPETRTGSVPAKDGDGVSSSEPDAALSGSSRPVVTSRLESFIAPGNGGRDLHRMSWQFAYAAPARSLSLQFPRGAVLLEMQWNDQILAAAADGDRWTVPVPEASAGDTLTVNFTLNSKDVYLRDSCHVGLPAFDAICASFEWVLHLRKGYAAVSLSEEMTRLDTGRPAGWLRWFFGPLARGAAADWFNPLSSHDWRDLLQSDIAPPAQAGGDTGTTGIGHIDQDQLLREWNIIRSVSAVVPHSLTIHVCRVDRLNALAWFVLVTTCLIGVVLRTCRVDSRNRIGLFWLSGCLAAAMIVPDRYAELIGAAILGTVIATLLPRSLIRSQPKRDGEISYPPMASTIALPRAKVSEILTVLLIVGVALFSGRTVAQNSLATLPDQIDVLVPYQGNRLDRDATLPEVVYLNSRVLRQLQQTAATAAESPTVLLTQTDWDGIIDRNSRSTVQGRLVVAVADTAGRIVDVPVPASLVDPESPVLLDGQPVSTLPGFDGASLLIPNPSHSRSNQQSSPDQSAAPDPAASDNENRAAPPALPETADVSNVGTETETSQTAETGWSLHTIAFRLRPEIRADREQRQFELPISPVARCGFRLKFELPPTFVRNSDNHASVGVLNDGTVVLQPGPVSHIAFDWSTGTTQAVPANVQTDVRSAAEIYPGRILRQTLARYVPADGVSVTQVAWRLPKQLQLDRQQIRAARLVDVSVQPQADHTLVTLEFEPAHTEPFSVLMNWQQILDAVNGTPDIQWETPVSAERARTSLSIDSHLAGLKAAPGFTLSGQLLQMSEQSRVANDTFLELWPDNERPRSPQIAIRIPVRDRPAVPAEIIPTQVQRAVRQNLDARIDSTQIRWTVSAEIETSNAPAFLHELTIPEVVRIDSVSLQRDEVDRLSHWERRGDRLFLFLRDRSTGIQNVTIEGRQQFDRQKSVPVPAVNVTGSQLLASTLQVYSQPGIRPIVHGAEAIDTPSETGGPDTSPATGYAGEFRLAENSQVHFELQTVRDEHPLRWLGILDLTPDGQLELELTLGVSTQTPREWTIQLPDWTTDQIEILEIDGMENVSSSESISASLDGRLLQLSVPTPGPEASELRLRLPVEPTLLDVASSGLPLRLSPPTCDEATQVPAAIASRRGTRRLEITGRLISDAQRQQLAGLFDMSTDTLGLLQWDASSEVSVEPESASVLPSIVLHSVRSGGRVAQICRTHVLVNAGVERLQIRWPASIQEAYRRVDGQLQQTGSRSTSARESDAIQDQRVEIIELAGPDTVHHLEFLWKPAPVSNRLKIRRETVRYPEVELEEPAEQYIEIIPSAGVHVLPGQDVSPGAGDREALIEQLALWQRYADGSSVSLPPGVKQTLATLLAATRADSPMSDVMLTDGEASADDTSTSPPQAPERDAAVGDANTLLFRAPKDGNVMVWLIDRHLDLVLLGIIVGLAVIAPILKFFSLEFGERLAGRPMLSFVLIGLVWWFCLQGSAAGFGLLLIAVFCWAAQSIVPRLFRRPVEIPAAR